ncbi:spoVK [Symbiodinium microadriaticum]|nr:spoVK [Symbiodinium microadriaticum]
MREFYASVEFAKVRKSAGLKALKSQSFHMRFLGNPGTGKTVVARIVGKLLIALGAISHPGNLRNREPVFNEVARSDLVAQYVGQTAPKVQKEVEKSLGGVFFLDEAYSLVNGERDQFGHEAVDTLIKEMEDKRANFVVICAGYEDEMDAFFDSNPGFKSRVPFTFFFEDYTCPQLMEIGLLSLKPKALTPPEDLSTYNDAISLSTGCCEKLEDCPPDKARGNGRAVRNVVEAAIRQMARRLQGTRAAKEEYSKLQPEDFVAVLSSSLQTLFAVPCGSRGPLAKIISLAELDPKKFQFFLQLEKELQGGKKEISTRLQRITSQIAVASRIRGLTPATRKHLETCTTKQQEARRGVIQRLDLYCSLDGMLDTAAQEIRTTWDKKQIETSSALLKATQYDINSLEEVLRALIPMGEHSEEAEAAIARCTAKLEQLHQADFRIPFDPFDS